MWLNMLLMWSAGHVKGCDGPGQVWSGMGVRTGVGGYKPLAAGVWG